MTSGIKYALIVSLATGLTGFTASAAENSSTATSSSGISTTKADHKTTSFIKDAAKDNQEEIALAELGASKSQNAELKSFCQMLQKDHTQAAQELQPIAQKYGITLEPSLSRKENKEVAKFEKYTGTKFDQEFATLMLKNHEKDIQKFQKASTELQAEDVKQFAASILPKLRQHFQHAETVAKAVGVDQATISSYSKRVGGAMGGTGSDTESSTGAGSSSDTRGDRLHDLRSGEPASQSGTSQAAPKTGAAR